MKPFFIVGVLNVTPDSFHDGGRFVDVNAAVAQATEMIADGADIIEIGGESTGPKSVSVPVDEEMRRVLPVITSIREAFPDASLSIDTYKSDVAAAAIREGVMMINDVTAGRGDVDMFRVVAASSAQYVMMYSKDPTPRTTIEMRQYEDVVGTVKTFLSERKAAAIASGISADRIILDPGLGHFVSSDPQYSFEIIRHLREFTDLGPLFVSPSRKSFLAGPQNLPTSERLPATIAASALAVEHGARYIRTHDVKEVTNACLIAIQAGSRS
jgi:dihydropteroate synthase